MIDPKDDKLDIGDKPNNDENKHIDIPLKPKIQQYFSVVERSQIDLKLIVKVTRTRRVQTVLHLATQHPPVFVRLLVISQRYLCFQWVFPSCVVSLRHLYLALHQLALFYLLIDNRVVGIRILLSSHIEQILTRRIKSRPNWILMRIGRHLVVHTVSFDDTIISNSG